MIEEPRQLVVILGWWDRFDEVQRNGRRVVGRGRCDKVYPGECQAIWDHDDDEHEEEIVGREYASEEYARSPVDDYWGTVRWADPETWEDAVAWMNGDDTRACTCHGECRCGKWPHCPEVCGVHPEKKTLCSSTACPEHPRVTVGATT